MPYKNKKDRNYRKEYDTYQGKPEQVKNRAQRNAARKEMVDNGRVHKHDNRDVDHIKPISKGGKNAKGNLRVKSAGSNRSFSRNSDHSVKRNGKA